MATPKLSDPSQPLPIRLILMFYEFCASLKLAVVLIFGLSFVLGAATFIDSYYGTPAVQFGAYGTWWFSILLFLLGVNVFCAASIRFPWKKHQTGFVITHVGLLVLLAGCYLYSKHGIDAQMPILEGGVSRIAYEDSHQIVLKRTDPDGNPLKDKQGNEIGTVSIPFYTGPFNYYEYDPAGYKNTPGMISSGFWGFFWGLPHKDLGVMYDQDGIKLEVLNFYASCKPVHTPYIDLAMTVPSRAGGQMGLSNDRYINHELSLGEDKDFLVREAGGGTLLLYRAKNQVAVDSFLAKPTMQQASEGEAEVQEQAVLQIGDKTFRFSGYEKRGQGRFPLEGTDYEAEIVGVYREPTPVIGSARNDYQYEEYDEQLARYTELTKMMDAGSTPEQVGEAMNIKTEDLAALVQKFLYLEARKLFKAGSTVDEVCETLKITVANLQQLVQTHQNVDMGPETPVIEINLFKKSSDEDEGTKSDEADFRLVMFAKFPMMNRTFPVDEKDEIYGNFWYDFGQLTGAQRMQGMSGSRIDFAITHDDGLLYRYWNGHQIVESGEMPTNGKVVNAFKMPMGQLKMRVNEYYPSQDNSIGFIPQPFDRKLEPANATSAAHFAVTVDGVREEFWLLRKGFMEDMFTSLGDTLDFRSARSKEIKTAKQNLSLELLAKTVDIQFGVQLNKFTHALDPGTTRAIDFRSSVNITKVPEYPVLDEYGMFAVDPENVNNPDIANPNVDIWMNHPVDITSPHSGRRFRLFQEGFQGPFKIDAGPKKYVTILSINENAGRGLIYLGCLLVCVGVFTMFYMKAYFFKRTKKKTTA
jgi:hypothetical protein